MDGTPLYAMHQGDNTNKDVGIARGIPAEQISGMNFANFNQDYSCISVGYENGFRIYSCDPFTQCYERIDGSIGIVEMLFCSSLLAIVGTGEQTSLSPRRLKIINTKRQTTICELTFPTSILSVRMNRERLVVMLEEIIYMYDITSMKLLHTIEILPNPNGLIALSTDVNCNYLAYPSSQKVAKLNGNGIPQLGVDVTALNGQQISSSSGQVISSTGDSKSHDELNRLNVETQTQSVRNGDVVIFDCKLLQPITVIEAHKTQLAAMAFSLDGTLLATASDKGTIVRVFSVKTGVKLYQFRRGSYNTRIYSLAFSPSNLFLIASSATGTVHIFRLGEQEAKNTIIRSNGSSGWINYKKSANDKSLEATRQEELDRLMKTRQSKLESHDILCEVEETDGSSNKKEEESPNTLQFENLNLNFDSEDEVESILDIEEEEGGEFDGSNDIDEENVQDQSTNAITTDGPQEIKFVVSANTDQKTQPVVEANRRSVARMLRRTSQKLGRKAAEKMGTYLPPKFSSILEPNRHFASLKVPSSKETMTIVGVTETTQDVVDINDNNSVTSHSQPHLHHDETSSTYSSNSLSASVLSRIHNLVVTIEIVSAEGIFYTYRLDPERGGDCTLLSQRSLFE